MKIKTFALIVLVSSIIFGCAKTPEKPTVLKAYPIENSDGLIAQSGVEFDSEISFDGNGSFKIAASESTTVLLYETGEIDIENARLIYRAKVRAEDVIGQVYLEMCCVFKGKGEFFSRGLQSLVTNGSDWKDTETLFYLKQGENPDNVKLNIVINGSGTIWIDDIVLLQAPLK